MALNKNNIAGDGAPMATGVSLVLKNSPEAVSKSREIGKMLKGDAVSLAKELVGFIDKAGWCVYSEDSDPTLIALVDKVRDVFIDLRKQEVTMLVSAILSDFRNVYSISKAVVPELLPVWEALVLNLTMTGDEVQRMALSALPVTRKKGRKQEIQYFNHPLMKACERSTHTSYYWGAGRNRDGSNYIFSLSRNMRCQMMSVLYSPEFSKLMQTPELPAEPPLVMGAYESLASHYLNYLSMLSSTGVLHPYDTKIPAAMMKKVVDGLSVPRLPMSPADKWFNHWGTNLVVFSYLDYARYVEMLAREKELKGIDGGADDSDAFDVKSFARFLVEKYPSRMDAADMRVLLPQFKGVNKRWTKFTNAAPIADEVVDMLKKVSKNNWINMDNFWLLYLSRVNAKTFEKTKLFNSYYASSMLLVNQLDQSRVTFNDQLQLLVKPFIYQYLTLLNVWGLVDMALIPEPDEGYPGNFWERLRYVRVTPLGYYAMGCTDTYVPPQDGGVGNVVFDVDANNGIVTVINENSPYALFLSQIGARITPKRFRVTAATIVASCDSLSDVESKIRKFVEFICDGNRSGWEEVFREAVLRARPFLDIDKDYQLYRLNPATPGLLEYIIGEKQFAGHVIKADGYHLMVERDFMSTFLILLRKAGYLV